VSRGVAVPEGIGGRDKVGEGGRLLKVTRIWFVMRVTCCLLRLSGFQVVLDNDISQRRQILTKTYIVLNSTEARWTSKN
jgi:hypothetical protein